MRECQITCLHDLIKKTRMTHLLPLKLCFLCSKDFQNSDNYLDSDYQVDKNKRPNHLIKEEKE
jgi:hypothetical protein